MNLTGGDVLQDYQENVEVVLYSKYHLPDEFSVPEFTSQVFSHTQEWRNDVWYNLV